MSKYEATFNIDSKSDSYAVRRVLEHVHDAVREESRTTRSGADATSELLQAFETLRDAVDHSTAGKLTITYQQADELDDE